jgi:hypothetical protein
MACITTQHRLSNQHLAIANQNFIRARHHAYGHRSRQKKQQFPVKTSILVLYCVRKLFQLPKTRRQEGLSNLLAQEGKSCDSDPDASEPDSLKTDAQQRRQIDISFDCGYLP